MGSADEILRYVEQNGLEVDRILDTHGHADHLTARRSPRQKTGAPMAIGEGADEIQHVWKNIPRLPDFPALQVDIRAGRLPEPEADGRNYPEILLDAFPGAVWDR